MNENVETQGSQNAEQMAEHIRRLCTQNVMFLVRCPDDGPSSCYPVDATEVDWLHTSHMSSPKMRAVEPHVWRWSNHSGSGVSSVGHTEAEAWERLAHFEEARHGHA